MLSRLLRGVRLSSSRDWAMRSICVDVSSVVEKEVGEDFACMRSSQRSTDTEKDYPIFIFTNYYVYRWRGQNYHSLGAAVGH